MVSRCVTIMQSATFYLICLDKRALLAKLNSAAALACSASLRVCTTTNGVIGHQVVLTVLDRIIWKSPEQPIVVVR